MIFKKNVSVFILASLMLIFISTVLPQKVLAGLPSNPIPAVTTISADLITENTVTLSGSIDNIGTGGNPTVRGFYYGTDPLLVEFLNTIENGSFDVGPYTAEISGLSCGTTYYYRVYATNLEGTGSGYIYSFTTTDCQKYTLTYTAGTNGTISGTTPQTVNSGSDGTPVTAVANSGYHFVNWSDSSTQNPRTDTNVTGDISVNANFVKNIVILSSGSYIKTIIKAEVSCPVGHIFSTETGARCTSFIDSPTTITNISRNLKLISPRTTGDDVKQLQLYLNTHGYDCGIPDGVYGTKTKAAVILFQKANNLTPDGAVGPLTRGKMK